MTSENLKSIILGLDTYFFPVNALLYKRPMRRVIREPRGLNVRCYAAHMINLNDNLDVLPGAKASERIFDT